MPKIAQVDKVQVDITKDMVTEVASGKVQIITVVDDTPVVELVPIRFYDERPETLADKGKPQHYTSKVKPAIAAWYRGWMGKQSWGEVKIVQVGNERLAGY